MTTRRGCRRCTGAHPAPAVLRPIVDAVCALALLAGCAATSPSAPLSPGGPPAPTVTACSAPTVHVTTAEQLSAALSAARPGTVIALGPGTYPGNFTAAAAGTPDAPIALCGGRDAVLDGGGTDSGYTLHLDGASYWQLSGFTVRDGQKGVMIDHGQDNLVANLLIEHTGDEGLHLRRDSSDNTVRGTEIHDTGVHEPKFGEGIYIGTAQSNWCTISDCQPDRSDRNTIDSNTISRTTAENLDIKEGTTGGTVRSNTFSGGGMTAATAWVNVKGNGWTIADNTGIDSPRDGFQQHQILPGWGRDNTFTANNATVNADGYAINITKADDNNTVRCDNVSSNAASGLSSIDCA